MYPKSRYAAEGVCFECHDAPWQYALDVAWSTFFSRLSCRVDLCFHLAMWRMRIPWLSSILFSQFQKGVLLDMANSILETISSEFASAAEKVGGSVVAVHARRWMPTSGIEWKKGVVVTVHHGVQRDEEINVLLGSGRAVSAKLAGRDPSTDIAVLRIEEGSSSAPQLGDSTSLRLGHLAVVYCERSSKSPSKSSKSLH